MPKPVFSRRGSISHRSRLRAPSMHINFCFVFFFACITQCIIKMLKSCVRRRSSLVSRCHYNASGIGLRLLPELPEPLLKPTIFDPFLALISVEHDTLKVITFVIPSTQLAQRWHSIAPLAYGLLLGVLCWPNYGPTMP